MCDDTPTLSALLWHWWYSWPIFRPYHWASDKLWLWNYRRKLIKAAGGFEEYEAQCRMENERLRKAWGEMLTEIGPQVAAELDKITKECVYPAFMQRKEASE